MSARLSKADREIVAQSKQNVEIETDRSVAGSMDETRSSKLKSDSDDDWWNPPTKTLRITSVETKLRWDQLQWKPHKDHFLQGSADWGVYKNDVMFALQSIGYVKGIKLTNLDKANFGSMIRRSVSEGPRRIIEDLSSGTDMMKLFDTTYRKSGMIQSESYFNDLLELSYDGGNSIEFVTKFRACVRDFKSTRQELSDNITILIFKRAVAKRAHRWHYEASHISKTKNWSLEELINDFISNHSLKTFLNQNISQKEGKPRVTSNLDVGRERNFNIQANRSENTGKLADKPKGQFGEKSAANKDHINCYVCGKNGHYANECKRGASNGMPRCYICKGDHFARQCPRRKLPHDQHEKQSGHKNKEKLIEYNAGEKWYQEWMRENGIFNNPEFEEMDYTDNEESPSPEQEVVV